VQRSGGVLPPLVWDAGTTVAADGLVQLRACLGTTAADPAPFCTAGRNVQLARSGSAGGSYGTATAGPGTVSLVTGDLSLSESDVDVPSYNGSLSIGRTLSTLSPSTVTTGATGVFGPAWTASLPGPDAGAADERVDDHSAAGYFTLISDDSSQDVYAKVSTAGTTTTYLGVGEDATDGSDLVKDTGPTPNTLTLSDLDGSSTCGRCPAPRGGSPGSPNRVRRPPPTPATRPAESPRSWPRWTGSRVLAAASRPMSSALLTPKTDASAAGSCMPTCWL